MSKSLRSSTVRKLYPSPEPYPRQRRQRIHRTIGQQLWFARHGEELPTRIELHHVNGNKWDYAESNLAFISRRDHFKLHRVNREIGRRLRTQFRKCGVIVKTPEHRAIRRRVIEGTIAAYYAEHRTRSITITELIDRADASLLSGYDAWVLVDAPDPDTLFGAVTPLARVPPTDPELFDHDAWYASAGGDRRPI